MPVLFSRLFSPAPPPTLPGRLSPGFSHDGVLVGLYLLECLLVGLSPGCFHDGVLVSLYLLE